MGIGQFFLSQSAITCSKLTVETLEQGVNKVNNKDTRTTPLVNAEWDDISQLMFWGLFGFLNKF